MNIHLKSETKEAIKAFSISGIIIVLFYLIISNLDILGGTIGSIFHALLPFIFGMILAFLLMPLRNLAENKLLKNTKFSKRTKRYIAVAISIVALLGILIAISIVAFMLLGILIGFFCLLVPQVISSISMFVGNLSNYITNVSKLIQQLGGKDTELIDTLTNLLMDGASQLAKWMTGASGGFTKLVSYVGDIVTQVINFFIGIIIALYLLLDSEKFILQMKKVTYCIVPENVALDLTSIFKLTADMFYKFISGKAIDSLIIGIICYVGCKLLNMPYSVLIALVVGITNMIPVFGPFIGAVPCLLILVMIDWIKATEFLVFVIVLQQCDGNIIGPYILGDAVGLPTLWVMFAIIIGGSMFGVVGMFIGVPTFAVIYTLVKQAVHRKLKQKRLNFDSAE